MRGDLMKETIRRALRTFFQAAAGYVAAHVTVTASGLASGHKTIKGALIALFTAAFACGIAAVMNLPADYPEEDVKTEEESEEKMDSGEGEDHGG